MENGSVDVAVIRGPMAGYLAARKAFPFTVEPLQSRQDDAEPPMAFDISMGVRRGDYALLQRLNDSLERNHGRDSRRPSPRSCLLVPRNSKANFWAGQSDASIVSGTAEYRTANLRIGDLI